MSKFETECQKEALRKHGRHYADLSDEECAEISKLVSSHTVKTLPRVKTKVTVVVRGGVVQDVYSTDPNMEFTLLDFDSDNAFELDKLEEELEKVQEEQNQIF